MSGCVFCMSVCVCADKLQWLITGSTYLLAVHSFCSLDKASFSSFRLSYWTENASSGRDRKKNTKRKWSGVRSVLPGGKLVFHWLLSTMQLQRDQTTLSSGSKHFLFASPKSKQVCSNNRISHSKHRWWQVKNIRQIWRNEDSFDVYNYDAGKITLPLCIIMQWIIWGLWKNVAHRSCKEKWQK